MPAKVHGVNTRPLVPGIIQPTESGTVAPSSRTTPPACVQQKRARWSATADASLARKQSLSPTTVSARGDVYCAFGAGLMIAIKPSSLDVTSMIPEGSKTTLADCHMQGRPGSAPFDTAATDATLSGCEEASPCASIPHSRTELSTSVAATNVMALPHTVRWLRRITVPTCATGTIAPHSPEASEAWETFHNRRAPGVECAAATKYSEPCAVVADCTELTLTVRRTRQAVTLWSTRSWVGSFPPAGSYANKSAAPSEPGMCARMSRVPPPRPITARGGSVEGESGMEKSCR